MPTIIALRGKSKTGKTQTIRILHGLLLENGYHQKQGAYEVCGSSKDFLDILVGDGKQVGIVSAGDKGDFVRKRLRQLINMRCEVIVCACRTRGATYDVVRGFQGYAHQYIAKQIARVNTQQVNQDDANNILTIVNGLIIH